MGRDEGSEKTGDEGFPILCAMQRSGTLPVADHVVMTSR